MAVYLIESVSAEDIAFKKVCIDGIQNTIKYEITSKIQFEPEKKLSVEAEIADAIQAYSIDNSEVSLTFKSITSDSVRILAEVSREKPLQTADVLELVNALLIECDNIK